MIDDNSVGSGLAVVGMTDCTVGLGTTAELEFGDNFDTAVVEKVSPPELVGQDTVAVLDVGRQDIRYSPRMFVVGQHVAAVDRRNPEMDCSRRHAAAAIDYCCSHSLCNAQGRGLVEADVTA